MKIHAKDVWRLRIEGVLATLSTVAAMPAEGADQWVETQIDAHKISTTIGHSGVWIAYMGYNLNDEQEFMQSASDRRYAVCRTLLASMCPPEGFDISEEYLLCKHQPASTSTSV